MVGFQCTAPMETMVRDIVSIGQEARSDFTEVFQSTFLDPKKSGSEAWKGDEFKVKVLTQMEQAWPTYRNPPGFIVPACIQQAIDHHHQFYKSFKLHQTHELMWSHSLGQMQLAFKPKNKKYKITMTPIQAYVCLSFTSFDEKLTGAQLNEMLNLDGEKGIVAGLSNTRKLKTALGSLMAKDKNVLACYDKEGKKTKKVKIDGSFSPDIKFKSDRLKFNMPKTNFNSKKVVSKVKEDRTMAIEACLVRIMKAASTFNQKALIAESMDQLSNLFKVEQHAIKKRIDYLIEGEYLGRDEEDRNLLMYLA